MIHSQRTWFFALLAGGIAAAGAQPAAPPPQAVPAMQALPLPLNQASFQREGRELVRFYFSADLKRPFWFPLLGPSGRSLTRMGHPRDPESHSHHNSLWISHHDVNGVDFWGDRGPAAIRHRRVIRYEDSPDEALMVTANQWMSGDKPVLDEERAFRVRPLPEGEWLGMIDIALTPHSGEVVLGKTPFGLVGVRMAKTIGVHDGGGRILNSEGALNEAGVLWKPARWVDYSGPVTPRESEGIALLDHPSNPNHPAVFHVRNDGWMGASLTFDAPRTLLPNSTLRLRYGLYIHAHQGNAAAIEKIWNQFAKPDAK